MAESVIIFLFLVFCCSIFTVRGKYVEGEINTQSVSSVIVRGRPPLCNWINYVMHQLPYAS